MKAHSNSDQGLAASITRAASKQTHYTICYLVDRDKVEDAYRAYAYFRWVDDWLDQEKRPRDERLAFVKRQQTLMEACYRGDLLTDLSPEEYLLVDLIRRDTETNSGLQTYVRNMMAVMNFDAERRGRVISQFELNEYTHWLAVAVMEALHYFIGHNSAAPQGEHRYTAVTGAHITHMLRDAWEDVKSGYYNIPREVTAGNGISPSEIDSKTYREWVKERVNKARACFRVGKAHFVQAENLRSRIAGYAYIRRFEVVLDRIEQEGYLLRAGYPECKSGARRIETIGWALWMALRYRQPTTASSTLTSR